jgi:hypothetical protein
MVQGSQTPEPASPRRWTLYWANGEVASTRPEELATEVKSVEVMPVSEHQVLREAAQALVTEGCREELGAPTYEKCFEPAEFILWGKLLPAGALGPRCYDHAAKHVGHGMLARRLSGDPLKLEAAIMDLRPLRAVLGEKP